MKNFLRVLTFNLKNDTPFTMPSYKWDKRYQYVKAVLKTIDFDILGVQELTNKNEKTINTLLSQYHGVGLSRGKKGKENDELSAIYFLKERFDCIKQDTFWLSNNPSIIGSKHKLSIFPRICTLVLLYDKNTNNYLLFANTHLDHLLPNTRKAQVEALIKIIEDYKANLNPLLIITGDFNTNINSSAIKTLLDSPLNIKGIYDEKSINTLHNFSGKKNASKEPIDHIFIDKRLKLDSYRIITNNYEGNYPSDHYPVQATINFED